MYSVIYTKSTRDRDRVCCRNMNVFVFAGLHQTNDGVLLLINHNNGTYIGIALTLFARLYAGIGAKRGINRMRAGMRAASDAFGGISIVAEKGWNEKNLFPEEDMNDNKKKKKNDTLSRPSVSFTMQRAGTYITYYIYMISTTGDARRNKGVKLLLLLIILLFSWLTT